MASSWTLRINAALGSLVVAMGAWLAWEGLAGVGGLMILVIAGCFLVWRGRTLRLIWAWTSASNAWRGQSSPCCAFDRRRLNHRMSRWARSSRLCSWACFLRSSGSLSLTAYSKALILTGCRNPRRRNPLAGRRSGNALPHLDWIDIDVEFHLSRRIGGLLVSEGRSNDLDGTGRVSGLHKDLSTIAPPHARVR